MDDSIAALREALVGRRVVAVEAFVVPADDYEAFTADYPVLKLDDGSRVCVLTDHGFPPLVSKEPE